MAGLMAGRRRSPLYTGWEAYLSSNHFRLETDYSSQLRLDTNVGGGASGLHYLENNSWYFLAMRYDDSTHRVSIFATTNSAVLSGPIDFGVGDLSSTSNFRLGSDGVSGLGGFDGLQGELDFVAFQDGYLSNQDIQFALTDFVDGYSTVPEPCSLALWSFAGIFGAGVTWRRRKSADKA